ncbi:MAG: DUF2851 family protein [Bacteroidales bacterium]|nr:DUF2851 family protein [Bacteroidales bacterium]
MNEMLLQYLWRNQIFSNRDFFTTQHQKLMIIHTGWQHQDAGPDFRQAMIKIGRITWVGDVEIHLKTSDWLRHGHQYDEKYQSVILHVVYENDITLNYTFPTLELKHYISSELLERYEKMYHNNDWLACRTALNQVSSMKITSLLSRMAEERLENKQREIFELLHRCGDDWHETTYRLLLRNFGFRTNSAAFELLAQSLPYRYINKHRNSRLQIYSLIFGQAGMLAEEQGDDYYNTLHKEYRYLQYKYHLTPISLKLWNLLRLRPRNFPCIRLAQASESLYRFPNIAQCLLEEPPMQALDRLHTLQPDDYWQTHFHFGKETGKHTCSIGDETINALVINTIIPLKFSFGTFFGNDKIKEQAWVTLENIPFEKNFITRKYQKMGFAFQSAMDSQAILELYHHYCLNKRCVECEIGCSIIR